MRAGGRLIGGCATHDAFGVRSVTRPDVTQPSPYRLAEPPAGAVDPTLDRETAPV